MLGADDLRRHALSATSAKSLLLTILGEYVLPGGEPVWSSTLMRALAALDVELKAARQAISRTSHDGWIAGQRLGRRVRWTLTRPGHRLLTQGTARIYSFGEARESWDGRWLLVMANVPESQRELRHRLRTRMAWAGFGSLAGLWLSPHAAREAGASEVIRELGLEKGATSFVATPGVLGDEAGLAAQAWDLAVIEARYADFIEMFAAPEAATFESHTRLVHEWRKFPFIDPELPLQLLPDSWIGVRAGELFAKRHEAGIGPATSWFES
jgi:phenylacetic acid degradation operon negative regulatory protein